MLPYISKRITSIEPVFSFEEDSPVVVSRSLGSYLTKLKNSIDEGSGGLGCLQAIHQPLRVSTFSELWPSVSTGMSRKTNIKILLQND